MGRLERDAWEQGSAGCELGHVGEQEGEREREEWGRAVRERAEWGRLMAGGGGWREEAVGRAAQERAAQERAARDRLLQEERAGREREWAGADRDADLPAWPFYLLLVCFFWAIFA